MMENDDFDVQNPDNCSNFLSTGYLEDALIEFGVRFNNKRRKLIIDESNEDDPFPVTPCIDNNLSYWSDWFTNYDVFLEEELSHANQISNDNNDMHFSKDEIMQKSMEMCEELNYSPETSTLDEIIGPINNNNNGYNNNNSNNNNNNNSNNNNNNSGDTCSTDSSSIIGEVEIKKKKKVNTSTSTSKMVYPFGLVRPGNEDGDITLNDINLRIMKPPTRPLKHPVGVFANRPAVSPDGPGLSGKAVVAFTKIHTQGRGTITIIRTKG